MINGNKAKMHNACCELMYLLNRQKQIETVRGEEEGEKGKE
jgi:hypothetical protein